MFALHHRISGRYVMAMPVVLAVFLASAKEPAASIKRPGEHGRLREGSKLVNVQGRMELVGDQATFTPAEGSESFRLLENLALERINQILSDSRDKSQWEISGMVTEYRGNNYLLVTKAVIKAGLPASPVSLPAPGKAGREP
jgi:hypothetical protein